MMKRQITYLMLITTLIVLTLACTRMAIPLLGSSERLGGLSIVLDPGHGGIATSESPTGGTIGPLGLREPDANLNIAFHLRDLLEDAGARVIMTREVDRRLTPIGSTYSQELQARADVTVLFDADLFISLHHNAPGPNTNPESVNNTSTYVYEEPTFFEEALAEAIQHNVAARLVREDKGVFKGDFHVLRENPVPAVLIEFSFLTNSAEENRVRDTRYNYLAALGVYDGLKTFFKTNSIKKAPVKTLEIEQDRTKPGYFIDHYVPRLYNPLRAEIDQRFLFGMPDANGKPRSYTTFIAPEDSPVYAAWDGIVEYVNTISPPDPRYPYNNCIIVGHDNVLPGEKLYTIYGNLKTVIAWTNQLVTPETIIGYSGSSDTEATHLKFEVRVGGKESRNIQNPELWIISVHNREAGYVVGKVLKPDKTNLFYTKINGLVKNQGFDKTPELYTYPRGVNYSTFWEESFAVSDVMPTPEGEPYHLIIGDRVLDIEVQPGKVTYVVLK